MVGERSSGLREQPVLYSTIGGGQIK